MYFSLQYLKFIFLSFLVILFVFTGIVLSTQRNLFPSAVATSDREVYADQLAADFSNWSWSADVDLSAADPVHTGTSSIAFRLQPWGGLYFHTQNLVDVKQYSSLTFALRPTQPNQDFNVLLYDSANRKLSSVLPLSAYISHPSVNTWNIYTIPFSDFTDLPSQISGFALQDKTGNGQPIVYIDDISFVKNPNLTSEYDIYTDELASGWSNWSWSGNVNFTNNYPTYEGTRSLALTTTQGWAGLYLHTDTSINPNSYKMLSFAAKASAEGQKYAVMLFDDSNQLIGSPIPLDNYSGQPDMNVWKLYQIPLQDLNPQQKLIKGVGLFDLTGKAQPTLYLDAIAFTNTSGKSSAADTIIPTEHPSPIPTLSQPLTPSPVGIQSPSSTNPLVGATLFNNPDTNPAASTAQQWQNSRPGDAAAMNKISTQPKAIWLGNWNQNIQSDTQSVVNKASAANAVPIFVAYNIPNRDCGSYSAGGSTDTGAYQAWINALSAGIGTKQSIVVLEPDALAQITCLSSQDQQKRFALLIYAVQKLKSLGRTSVYLDAGHAGWIAIADMAQRLKNAGVAQADGFALNVSNFDTTADSIVYGQQLSSQIGVKHFVIDTSRNGNGPTTDNQWCNPPGRALGEKPTTDTNNFLVDAYLWLKYPGESDGSCNGGPAAGQWYPEYALGLAQRANW